MQLFYYFRRFNNEDQAINFHSCYNLYITLFLYLFPSLSFPLVSSLSLCLSLHLTLILSLFPPSPSFLTLTICFYPVSHGVPFYTSASLLYTPFHISLAYFVSLRLPFHILTCPLAISQSRSLFYSICLFSPSPLSLPSLCLPFLHLSH